MISRMSGSPEAPICQKPVTAVIPVTVQVSRSMLTVGGARRPVTGLPKTGYTSAASCQPPFTGRPDWPASDLPFRKWPTGITAVTGFADKGALGASGSCETTEAP